MSSPTPKTATPASRAAMANDRVELPPTGQVYAARARVEILEFFRQKEALVFTLIFPSMLLLIFGAVLNFDLAPGLTFVQYFMAGMVASGVLASGFQNLAITIAIERSEGLVVGLITAAGHPVLMTEPAGFCAARPRWGSAGTKSDTGDAFMLADYPAPMATGFAGSHPSRTPPESSEFWCVPAPAWSKPALRHRISSGPCSRSIGQAQRCCSKS